ncbi:MAG: synthase subunit epsilon [Bacteroidetes bacterium]|nr:synthase subunit epsilon [Bacteroidota bacterium]
MYEKPFKLEIVSPRRVVYTGDATSVSLPGALGGFQVLHNHAPLLSSLNVGTMKLRTTDGTEVFYATSGGFVEVRDNVVTVVVESAERADEIDVDRAQRAVGRAQERLKKRSADIDVPRAEAALARAMNRLSVAERV